MRQAVLLASLAWSLASVALAGTFNPSVVSLMEYSTKSQSTEQAYYEISFTSNYLDLKEREPYRNRLVIRKFSSAATTNYVAVAYELQGWNARWLEGVLAEYRAASLPKVKHPNKCPDTPNHKHAVLKVALHGELQTIYRDGCFLPYTSPSKSPRLEVEHTKKFLFTLEELAREIWQNQVQVALTST